MALTYCHDEKSRSLLATYFTISYYQICITAVPAGCIVWTAAGWIVILSARASFWFGLFRKSASPFLSWHDFVMVWWFWGMDKIVALFVWCCHRSCHLFNSSRTWRETLCSTYCRAWHHQRRIYQGTLFISTEFFRYFLLDAKYLFFNPVYQFQ